MKQHHEPSQVFARVAPHYALMNDIMSLGLHRWWRAVLVSELLKDSSSHSILLDVAGGGGDIARAFLEKNPHARAILCDASPAMLHSAPSTPNITRLASMAEQLPLKDNSVTHCSCAYGLRNFNDYPAALKEMKRVLTIKSTLAIMELGCPTHPLIKDLHRLYLQEGLKRLGCLIASDGDSYDYLGRSILQFDPPPKVASHIKAAGFDSVRHYSLHEGVIDFFVAHVLR